MIEQKTPRLILEDLYEQKNFVGLIDYCTTQAEVDPSNYLYFGARGKALYDLDRLEEAIIDLTKAIELNPEYVSGFYNRSHCYFDLQSYPLAIEDIEKAHSIDSESRFFDLLGLSYACIDNHSKAIESFDYYLETHKDPELLLWKAEAHVQLNQLKEAVKIYELILLLDLENEKIIDQITHINRISDDQNHDNHAVIGNVDTFDYLKITGFSEISDESKCGVYILKFTNDEYYIGQAKNIKIRLKQHYKRFDDINSIVFKPVLEAYLLKEENRMIAIFEQNLQRIRNIKQINFRNLFNPDKQNAWISNMQYNYLSGKKFDNSLVRQQFAERFCLLKNMPYYSKLVAFLVSYMKKSIPNYLASEYNYWNVTCLPKHLKQDNCISRININAVPVLSVWANEDDSMEAMFIVSKLPFLNYLKDNLIFGDLFENIISLKFELRNVFEITEGDELALFVHETDFYNILNNEVILSGIRLFNLRMMNKVGQEQGFRRSVSHCLDLADLILADDQQSVASS